MTEENQSNLNSGIQTEKDDLYKGMDRSELLSQDREQAKSNMLANKGNVDAIQQYMNATDNLVAQLKAEKRMLNKQADDNKNMWVKSNTYTMDQGRKIEYLEEQLRKTQSGQLQGIDARQVISERNFAEHQSKEGLKNRLSNHFKQSLKNDKW